MSRIVYLAFPQGVVAGGQKMIARHVETLRELGFEALLWYGPTSTPPANFSHRAPTETGTPFRPDDILVVPNDAPNAIASLAALPNRTLVFCQNQFSFATVGYEAVDRFPPERFPVFISPGRLCAASIRRAYPQAQVEVIPCFADERVFKPGPVRRPAIAYTPHKRAAEARTIHNMFRKFRPDLKDLPWVRIEKLPEAEVARLMSSSTLFLSLSRFESVGMTPLEAMACGAVCAGFTGIGGREYATPANGFWVGEDDLEAAADALAQAADLVASGGAALEARLAAGRETAQAWSYAIFRQALEEVWTRLAPEARRSERPLD